MIKKPIAYQLYSAREEAAKDLDSVLSSLKALGYDGVEFAGFYGHSAEEIKAMLKKHNLVPISSHLGLPESDEAMRNIIAYHKAVGCQYMAVPGLSEEARPGGKGFAKTLAAMHHFARLIKEAGMTLLYHNHDFEFIQISGQYGLDFMFDAIPADLLETEIDVCWVKYAGIDPAAYIRQYANRCPLIHLKDYVGEQAQGTFEDRPVGYGCQDISSIVTAGLESGVKWFVVEEDDSPTHTPIPDAKKSIETLKALHLK